MNTLTEKPLSSSDLKKNSNSVMRRGTMTSGAAQAAVLDRPA